MSTTIARKALQENLDRYISQQTDQVMFNLHVALFQITKTLDEIDRKTDALARQVSQRR